MWLRSRWVRRARAGCAALLLTFAVLSALPGAGTPGARAPARAVDVPVAARDLAGGSVLRPEDVQVLPFAAGTVPAGALRSAAAAVGRTLAGSVRRNEPLTDARVVGPGLAVLAGGSGAVAVPVRLADPGVAGLLRPGDRVDVVAIGPGGSTNVIVSAAPVLALPAENGESARSTVEGALVVLAVPAYLAPRLSSTALTARLTVTLRPP